MSGCHVISPTSSSLSLLFSSSVGKQDGGWEEGGGTTAATARRRGGPLPRRRPLWRADPRRAAGDAWLLAPGDQHALIKQLLCSASLTLVDVEGEVLAELLKGSGGDGGHKDTCAVSSCRRHKDIPTSTSTGLRVGRVHRRGTWQPRLRLRLRAQRRGARPRGAASLAAATQRRRRHSRPAAALAFSRVCSS